MRIVIDTNVVVSGIFFGGRPKDLIEKLIMQKFDAYASVDIVTEYKETVEELCSRYGSKPGRIPLTEIISLMKIVGETQTLDKEKSVL